MWTGVLFAREAAEECYMSATCRWLQNNGQIMFAVVNSILEDIMIRAVHCVVELYFPWRRGW